MFRRSVRATPLEQTRGLPGDDLIKDPVGSVTHAVTIERPPREVWPWLAQMGAGSRAGWYSYDFIDNGRHPSANRILPQLQGVTVGTIFPALPGVTAGFVVIACDRERALILGWPSQDHTYLTTWTFLLEPSNDHSTRLIVRSRAARGYRFRGLPMWAIKAGHFIMQRKQLLEIARRCERSPASSVVETDPTTERTKGAA